MSSKPSTSTTVSVGNKPKVPVPSSSNEEDIIYNLEQKGWLDFTPHSEDVIKRLKEVTEMKIIGMSDDPDVPVHFKNPRQVIKCTCGEWVSLNRLEKHVKTLRCIKKEYEENSRKVKAYHQTRPLNRVYILFEEVLRDNAAYLQFDLVAESLASPLLRLSRHTTGLCPACGDKKADHDAFIVFDLLNNSVWVTCMHDLSKLYLVCSFEETFKRKALI